MRLRRNRRKLLIEALVIISIFAAVLITYFALQTLLATSTPFVAVASGSMSPALKVGDLVMIHGVRPSDIQVGDIIVFDPPQASRTIHRVTQVQTLPNGTLQFQTRGDANPTEDVGWTSEQYVLGRVTYVIPLLGWLWLEPAILVVIIVISLIIILVWPENQRKRKRKFPRPSNKGIAKSPRPDETTRFLHLSPGSVGSSDASHDRKPKPCP